MGVRVTITWDGIEEAVSRLGTISERGQQNLVKLTKQLSDDGTTAWKEATPEGKTKQLRGGEKGEPAELSVTFSSPTYYYKFVDEGHYTPKGWRRLRKVHDREVMVYVKAKHRSHVAGREMTPKLVDWLKTNTPEYLSKFLDGV